ncbi:hypothetical protein BGW80DRAFT_152758 [Lactifluus volemus]|nr:hypothetical protein BGW80DRAFT_152758 [Lactifluus volemus]
MTSDVILDLASLVDKYFPGTSRAAQVPLLSHPPSPRHTFSVAGSREVSASVPRANSGLVWISKQKRVTLIPFNQKNKPRLQLSHRAPRILPHTDDMDFNTKFGG